MMNWRRIIGLKSKDEPADEPAEVPRRTTDVDRGVIHHVGVVHVGGVLGADVDEGVMHVDPGSNATEEEKLRYRKARESEK